MILPPELIEIIFRILFPELEAKAMRGEGASIRFLPFCRFQKSGWKVFSVVLNMWVRQSCVEVKLDEHGKVMWGRFGNTTFNAPEQSYELNGKLCIEHDEEFLGWQTVRRMYRFYCHEYHQGFSVKSMDLICGAAGYDGVRGFMHEHDIDPWDFHWF